MKKLAAIFAPFLMQACVTVNYEKEPDMSGFPFNYAVYEEGKKEPTIKESHFPLFPPVEDEACGDSCKSACMYLYKNDKYKYHDCVNTQTWWLTPSLKPRSLADSY